jgi:hypothetical protein
MREQLVTASQQVAVADGGETTTDPAALRGSPPHPHESSVPCTLVVRDLQASTGCTIHIVTATHHAIRQALGRIYDIAEEKAEGIEHLD